MKKSLFILAWCLGTLGAYAQDDDVYFVPSSKEKTETHDTYKAGHSTYAPIGEEDLFNESNWAEGRGNGNFDVDAYNRRGNKNQVEQTDQKKKSSENSYEEGYKDGFEDASCTSRIVRFCSPHVGVYVSSPYYWDYYDLCYYDPWYYNPWHIGWSSWYGWYGWGPYYHGWYDPWYNPWYSPWWGPSYAWYPTHWYPSNAQRGPVGGYIAYGGARGTGSRVSNGRGGTTASSRPSRNYGRDGGYSSRGGRDGNNSYRPSRSFNSNRSSQYDKDRHNSNRYNSGSRSNRPSRSFGNSGNSNRNSNHRSSNFSSPSRSHNSSFGSGHSNFGGGRSGFGGGRSGGGRSGGGRR